MRAGVTLSVPRADASLDPRRLVPISRDSDDQKAMSTGCEPRHRFTGVSHESLSIPTRTKRWRSGKPPPLRTPILTNSARSNTCECVTGSGARNLGTLVSACLCSQGTSDAFFLVNWRRRSDLNRGWRFCRQGRDVYLVDSSCFLVGPTPSFSPVFGRNCSQVVPRFGDCERLMPTPQSRLPGSEEPGNTPPQG